MSICKYARLCSRCLGCIMTKRNKDFCLYESCIQLAINIIGTLYYMFEDENGYG